MRFRLFHDAAPDALGRRTFTDLTWDAEPVHCGTCGADPYGPRACECYGPMWRGQVFYARPDDIPW